MPRYRTQALTAPGAAARSTRAGMNRGRPVPERDRLLLRRYDLVARRRAPAASNSPSNATATAGSAGTAVLTSTSNMTDATGVEAL